jgi:hypothetical protein
MLGYAYKDKQERKEIENETTKDTLPRSWQATFCNSRHGVPWMWRVEQPKWKMGAGCVNVSPLC